MQGLIKEILDKLEIEFDETQGLLSATRAQELLDTKTSGISTYSIEMLHYGYNITLDKLLNLNRERAGEILNNMMEQFGHIHRGENTPTTIKKITWLFNKDLFNVLYDKDIDPFRGEEPQLGKYKYL